jgi:hypothetical protein
VANARTGLPKNHACLLIILPYLPEGDLRGSWHRVTLRERASVRFNKKKHKKKHKTAG